MQPPRPTKCARAWGAETPPSRPARSPKTRAAYQGLTRSWPETCYATARWIPSHPPALQSVAPAAPRSPQVARRAAAPCRSGLKTPRPATGVRWQGSNPPSRRGSGARCRRKPASAVSRPPHSGTASAPETSAWQSAPHECAPDNNRSKPPPRPAAHNHRLIAQRRIIALFHAGIKGVTIHMRDGEGFQFSVRNNARAATRRTPRTAGKKGKAIATQAGHDGGRVAWGEGEGNGLLKCILWGILTSDV